MDIMDNVSNKNVNEDNIDYELNWTSVWLDIKKDGYVWQDVNGKKYKAKDLSTRYLKNILLFCDKNFRPNEQTDALKKILYFRERNKK